MSDRKWEKVRRVYRGIERALDNERRSTMRVPLVVRIVSAIQRRLSPYTQTWRERWVSEWDKRHRAALRRVMKYYSHKGAIHG